jgi:hypothetical protein
MCAKAAPFQAVGIHTPHGANPIEDEDDDEYENECSQRRPS